MAIELVYVLVFYFSTSNLFGFSFLMINELSQILYRLVFGADCFKLVLQ